jgi:hypothetical protein
MGCGDSVRKLVIQEPVGLQLPHQEENEQYNRDDTESPAGAITPTATMWPCRDSTNKQEHEDNKENCSDGHFLSSHARDRRASRILIARGRCRSQTIDHSTVSAHRDQMPPRLAFRPILVRLFSAPQGA